MQLSLPFNSVVILKIAVIANIERHQTDLIKILLTETSSMAGVTALYLAFFN